MKLTQYLWIGLLLLLISWPVLARGSVYFHNRALEGRWEGGEFYVTPAQLSVCLDAEELARVELDESQKLVRVGSETFLFSGGSVPVLALARALGLRRIDSNGVVDFVKIGKNESPNPQASPVGAGQPGPRRGEYQVAAKNLEMLMRTRFPLSNDGPRAARVAAIGQKVVKSSPLRDIPWKFLLVRASEPNAACVGEGHVMVTTGLLDLGLTDDELAGVLGHEIAHGVRRHAFVRTEVLRQLETLMADYNRLRDEVAAGNPSTTLRAAVDDYEKRRGSLQHRLDNAVFYSQLQEEEADVVGLRYAVEAGYSADGLSQGLKRLEQFQIEHFGTAVLQEGLSHPPVRKRLEILTKARRNGGF